MFFISPSTQNLSSYKGKSQCFFKAGLYKFRHFLFLVEVFCKSKSSYHFGPMFRLRSTNSLLDINKKLTSVERGGLQNDLFCLQTTKLSVMTQGPSKFSACRSDAGLYKPFFSASMRQPQTPTAGLGITAQL